MSLIVFDVNETLSDLSPMGQRFVELGAPESLAATWFAATLRDGIGLTLTGDAQPFADVARGVLASMRGHFDRDPGDHVLDAFASLDLHPDAARGIPALAAAGHTVVTLSNGSTSVAEGLLGRNGMREHVHAVLSVEDAPDGAWKPAPAAYTYALEACSAINAMLVAVHPWDVHGAKAAGLRAAYVDRAGDTAWPDVFTRPDLTVRGIDELTDRL